MVASAMMARELEPGLRELLAQRRAGAGEVGHRSVSVGSDDGVLYARVYVSDPDPGGDVVVRVFGWGLPYTFSDLPTDGVGNRDRDEPVPPWGRVGRDPDGFGVRIARELCVLAGGRELDPAQVAELLAADRLEPEKASGWREFVQRLRAGGSRDGARPDPSPEDAAHGLFVLALHPAAGGGPAEDGPAEIS